LLGCAFARVRALRLRDGGPGITHHDQNDHATIKKSTVANPAARRLLVLSFIDSSE